MIARFLLTIVVMFLSMASRPQTLQWAYTQGGSSTDNGFGIATDGTGAAISVGVFRNTIDLDPGPGVLSFTSQGGTDWFIQKVDASGVLLWARTIGGVNNEELHGVATDSQNNIILAGWVRGTVDLDPGPGQQIVFTDTGSDDLVLMKLTPTGDLMWAHHFGGLFNDDARRVAVDQDDNILLTGRLAGPVDMDPGPGVTLVGTPGAWDAYVAKYDPAGGLLWAVGFNGVQDGRGLGLAVDANANVFVAGEFNGAIDLDPGPSSFILTSDSLSGGYLAKLDASGNFLWGVGVLGMHFERCTAVAVGPDGAPVITGRIGSTVDFDPGPGVFPIAGIQIGDAYVAKYSSSGALLWAFPLRSGFNSGFAMAVDAFNNVYVGGAFGTDAQNVPLDLDPGPGTNLLFNNGQVDAFLASYGPTGSMRWGFGFGSPSNDYVLGIAIGLGARVHITGQFFGTVDLAPGPPVSNLVSNGLWDAYTATYEQAACGAVLVAAKAFLQGALHADPDLMDDALRTAAYVPLTEPYSALGYSLQGGAATAPAVLTQTGPNAVVDWVLVELRDPGAPDNVVERRAALLQRDGDIVDVDGLSPVPFCLSAKSAHIAVRHRNHLGVMTALPQSLSGTPVAVDLTDPATSTFGIDARIQVGPRMALWSGNVMPDGALKYVGSDNDRDPILQAIGGVVPTATITGYHTADVNLDGVVKYVGAGNDRDLLLLNIGGVVPTNTRTEQLP
ncbi:MAG: hypothetical protein KF905_09430 [Flavobacteriales bacterium]|nr:hypothetical protein [Flavobacteriales bacterium]